MRCTTCRNTDYVAAPATNSWRLFFARIGRPWQMVLVPCPACGGVMGRANRAALMKRLEARKAGPLMVRHVIDGHEVLLPADAKLYPRAAAIDRVDDTPLGGTY